MQRWKFLTRWMVAIGLALSIGVSKSVFAQSTDIKLPVLSLTGSDPGYDPNIYLGGVIVVPEAAPGQRRELLVPVYIRNCWVPANDSVYGKVWPIYSLDFKFKYDGQLLEFVGLQKVGPRGDSVLAKDFAFSFDDARITSSEMLGALVRWHNLGSRFPPLDSHAACGSSQAPLSRCLRALPSGRILGTQQCSVTSGSLSRSSTCASALLGFRGARGSSSCRTIRSSTTTSISRSSLQSPFRIILRDGNTVTACPTAMGVRPGDVAYEGLGGVDNRGLLPAANQWTSMPGVAHLYITAIPKIGFEPDVGINAVVRQVSADEWEVIEPIVLDSASQLRGVFYGRRELVVTNEEPGTRLTDVVVESNARWLKFQTFGTPNPIPLITRRGVIPYIDRTLGESPLTVDVTNNALSALPPQNFRILCDPSELPQNTDAAGIYVGYITFSSLSAEVSPVRLRVTFIYVRNPVEPNNDPRNLAQLGKGIRITVTNSAATPESATLLFGLGIRATDGIDTLFGETIYDGPPTPGSFYARWYLDGVANVPPGTAPYGLRDLVGVYDSRDIRNVFADSTVVFLCRFDAGGALNYPVILDMGYDGLPRWGAALPA
jgi:hypothetical protein